MSKRQTKKTLARVTRSMLLRVYEGRFTAAAALQARYWVSHDRYARRAGRNAALLLANAVDREVSESRAAKLGFRYA